MSLAKMLYVVSFGLWCIFLALVCTGLVILLIALLGDPEPQKVAKGIPAATGLINIGKGIGIYFAFTLATGCFAFAFGKMGESLERLEWKRKA